jgi:amino acid carrier protein
MLHSFLTAVDDFIWGPTFISFADGHRALSHHPFRSATGHSSATGTKTGFFPPKHDDKEGDVSSFAALCTALSATIGTGNIVGVATAVKLGGPGAIFWMWMAAFLGMATKYAEGLLAVRYRQKDANGQMSGGPMYYLEKGLGSKFLACSFALFGIGVALFGIGTFPQVNAIADAAQLAFEVPKWATGLILAVLVALITLGGIQSISRISTKVVPFMAILYVLTCFGVMYLHAEQLPAVVNQILNAAFTTTAATGGFAGATMMLALQAGVARGVFSNESGLGSAPIAAAAAKTDSCVEQGLVCMTGTFFDTIIICTMTGITLVLTGAWQSDVAGTAMTNMAFTQGIGSQLGFYLVNIGLLFFAFTTIIGWNYYGERCTEYLLGVKAIKGYRWIFVLLVAAGAFLHLDLIWIIADIG